jgi:hypothetical protein
MKIANKFGLYYKLVYLCSVNYLMKQYGHKIYRTGKLGGNQRND